MYLENPNIEETETMFKIFKKIANQKILNKDDIYFFEENMIGYMLHENQRFGSLSNKVVSEILYLDFENVKEYILENFIQKYNPMINEFKKIDKQ